MAAVRYVEQNPVRAKITEYAWKYIWSSAAYHVGEREKDCLVRNDAPLKELVGDWREYLGKNVEESDIEQLRRESYGCRPLGDESFLESLEKRLGMTIKRKTSGRPKKIK